MKITKNLNFTNFRNKNSSLNIINLLYKLLGEDNHILNSLSKSYKNNFGKKLIYKYKNFSNINIIGMGGSILGSKCIFNFFKHKIKKKFNFYDRYIDKNFSGNLKKKNFKFNYIKVWKYIRNNM